MVITIISYYTAIIISMFVCITGFYSQACIILGGEVREFAACSITGLSAAFVADYDVSKLGTKLSLAIYAILGNIVAINNENIIEWLPKIYGNIDVPNEMRVLGFSIMLFVTSWLIVSTFSECLEYAEKKIAIK